MFFKEVIGQEEIKNKLIRSVQSNRVSHTQLFLGPEGSGNLAIALAFAQYLNCENKGADDSCGACASCIKSQKMIHPDTHYSFPSMKIKDRPSLSVEFMPQWRSAVIENPYLNYLDWVSLIGGDNKQGNITADECRDIFSKLNLKVFESEYKVLIMWMPERLGKEGNILLKLFEEPAQKTLILLVAENRDLLLGTILSRTQIVSIPRLNDEVLLQAMTDRHGLSAEAAAKIVRKANGSYNEALRLLNHVEDNNQELFNRWMQLIYTNGSTDLVRWVEEVSRIGRENQKSFFLYTLEFLHECIALQMIGEPQSRLQKEEIRLATWLSQNMEESDWQTMMELFDNAHFHIERNAHPKILFMNLSIELKRLISRKKLSLTN